MRMRPRETRSTFSTIRMGLQTLLLNLNWRTAANARSAGAMSRL